MKTVLAILLVLVVAAGLGMGAWYFLGGAPTVAVPNAASSQPSAGFGVISNQFVKAPALPTQGGENFADVLDVLDQARAKNPDTAAWLAIPNTKINNAVMQAQDNAYYLRRTETGVEDIYGCYFADYACNFSDRSALRSNTLIYGHSDLKDNPLGPKFSELFRFTKEEFAQQNRRILLTLDGEQTQWEIISVFYTDTAFDYITPEVDAAGMVSVAREAMARSLYQYGVEIGVEDKLLTLSTCSVKFGKNRSDIRFVVMARLLPVDEKPSDQFAVNPTPWAPK